MTSGPVRLTDDALHRALVELAGHPGDSALLTHVMRTVDVTPQVRRRPWDIPPLGRGALLVAAALAALGIGAAVALTQPQPSPQPAPSTPAREPERLTVAEFVLPFRYVIPEGETDEVTQLGGPGVYPLFGLFRGSANLTVFEVTGIVHSCELEKVPEQSEPVRVGQRLGTDPATYVEDLRNRVGIEIDEGRPGTLGNLPAVEAEIGTSETADCYPQAHVDGMGIGGAAQEPELRGPGKLIVAEAERRDRTIGVLIKAADQAAYEAFLPVAEAYLRSFDFYTADN